MLTESEQVNLIEILGGKRALGVRVRQEEDLIEQIHRGLPYKTLESVMERMEMEMAFVIAFLGVTARTLQRRQTENVLTREESDRVVRLAKLYERTVKVLGDPSEARAWLHHRNITLGSKTPLEVMDTVIGEARVTLCSAESSRGSIADAGLPPEPKETQRNALQWLGSGKRSGPLECLWHAYGVQFWNGIAGISGAVCPFAYSHP